MWLKLVPRERPVFLDDLAHLFFDACEVVGADGLFEVEVVVEAIVEWWAVGEFCFGPEAFDGLGHDVGGGVSQEVERVFLVLVVAVVGDAFFVQARGGDEGEVEGLV